MRAAGAAVESGRERSRTQADAAMSDRRAMSPTRGVARSRMTTGSTGALRRRRSRSGDRAGRGDASRADARMDESRGARADACRRAKRTTGRARARALWRKGEHSGHVQRVREIRLDCDGDAILLIVEQVGGIACHTGRERCFYRRLDDGEWHTVEPVLEDPATDLRRTTMTSADERAGAARGDDRRRARARDRRHVVRRGAAREGRRRDPEEDRRGSDRDGHGREGR